jgi:glucose-6-phosphate 1-dehydrogenase
VIAAFRPLQAGDVVRGQYTGYTDLEGIADDSQTETYVAARLWIDTDRWHGVPFVLRSGKRMAASAQQVSLVMRKVEGPVTHQPDGGNVIGFSLAGSGVLEVDLAVKEPGAEFALGSGTAALDLTAVEDGDPLPPYAKLLHDVLTGDRSLFTTGAGLKEAWRAAAGVLSDPPPVQPYEPGSWGPAAADALPRHRWILGGAG